MIYLILVLLGLCFGSFVSALTWRIHEQATKSKFNDKDLSIVRGRSMCPNCKHQLAWYDLLPLLSWVASRGKCRYCKQSINWQYPALELSTAVIFVISYIVWPYGFESSGIILLVSWLLTLVGLIALIVYDLKWMVLPNKIVYPLTVFWAIVLLVIATFYNGSYMPFAGGITIFGLFWTMFQVSEGRWIGGGDVKLGLLLGMLAGGILPAIAVIFMASIIGLAYSMPAIIRGKLTASSRIPFGPSLILATGLIFLSNNLVNSLITRYIYPY